jgi:hypothetical protein
VWCVMYAGWPGFYRGVQWWHQGNWQSLPINQGLLISAREGFPCIMNCVGSERERERRDGGC